MTEPRKTAPKPIEIDTLQSVTGGVNTSFDPKDPDADIYVSGTWSSDVIATGGGNDTIVAHGGNDRLAGGGGDDVIHAGEGNDMILWGLGLGNDSVDGGDGTDTLMLNVGEMSPEEVLAAITVAPGSPQPTLVDGRISLAGVTGTLTLGGHTLSFTNLERVAFMGPP